MIFQFDLIYFNTLTFHVPRPSCGMVRPLFKVMFGTGDAIVYCDLLLSGKLLNNLHKISTDLCTLQAARVD